MIFLSWVCDAQDTGTARLGPVFLLRNFQQQSPGKQVTAGHPPWVAFNKPDNPGSFVPCTGMLSLSLFLDPFWSQLIFALVISSCCFFICWEVSQASGLLFDLLIARGMNVGYRLFFYTFKCIDFQRWAAHFYFLFYSHFFIWVA